VTTQSNTIRATLSQCRHAQPLVILDLLGQGAELRPAELRAPPRCCALPMMPRPAG